MEPKFTWSDSQSNVDPTALNLALFLLFLSSFTFLKNLVSWEFLRKPVWLGSAIYTCYETNPRPPRGSWGPRSGVLTLQVPAGVTCLEM